MEKDTEIDFIKKGKNPFPFSDDFKKMKVS